MELPDGTRRYLKGGEARLWRLLMVFDDEVIPLGLVARYLEIKESSVSRYVGDLRTGLGDPSLVLQMDKTVKFAGDVNDSDMMRIQFLFESLRGEFPSHDLEWEISDAVARASLDPLDEIVKLWKGNPATGFNMINSDRLGPDFQDWVFRFDLAFSTWVDLYREAKLRRSLALITLGDGHDVSKVHQELRNVAIQEEEPSEVIWGMLLRSADMLGGNEPQRVSDLLRKHAPDKVLDHFRQRLASPKTDIGGVTPSPAAQRFEDDQRALRGGNGAEDDDPRLAIAEMLGITTASALQLRGSKLAPEQCIPAVKRRLYFSGVMASKWVVEGAVRADFEQMLLRLEMLPDEPGDVRFLIMQPYGEAYEELSALRGGMSDDSVPILKDLAKRYQCFEVRTLDALPAFRIVDIDDDLFSFSLYQFEDEPYKLSRFGWTAPHVMLDPSAPHPLARAFKIYFEDRWNRAEKLR